MTPLLAGKDTGTARAGEYARHRPEQTRLYQLVEQSSYLKADQRVFRYAVDVGTIEPFWILVRRQPRISTIKGGTLAGIQKQVDAVQSAIKGSEVPVRTEATPRSHAAFPVLRDLHAFAVATGVA